ATRRPTPSFSASCLRRGSCSRRPNLRLGSSPLRTPKATSIRRSMPPGKHSLRRGPDLPHLLALFVEEHPDIVLGHEQKQSRQHHDSHHLDRRLHLERQRPPTDLFQNQQQEQTPVHNRQRQKIRHRKVHAHHRQHIPQPHRSALLHVVSHLGDPH